MEQKEREYLKLADGREVREGPWIKENVIRRIGYLGRAFDVVVRIYPAITYDRYNKNTVIVRIDIPSTRGTVTVPKIEILLKEFWPKELVVEVIQLLKRSSDFATSSVSREYIISKLAGVFEKEKELGLPDGRLLVGDFDYNLDWQGAIPGGHENLLVLGKVKNLATGVAEQIILFTIKNLHMFTWPESNTHPSYQKNKDVWCKRLEYRVISYLNLLAEFSDHDLDKQIINIANQLTNKSEWAVRINKLTQKLLTLGPEIREDERVKQIFDLADELAGLKK